MKHIFLLSLMLCTGFFSQSQNVNNTTLNNYKYVVVPLNYSFLKGENVYRLNTLTKYLLKQNGFNAYFDREELPEDVFSNRCLALYADVEEVRGGFRKTKLQVTFKDCYGKLVFTSDEGSSSQNNHKDAHHEALRQAFETFEIKTYSYKPQAFKSNTKLEEAKPLNSVKDVKKSTSLNASVKTGKITSEETITNKANTAKVRFPVFNAIKIKSGFELINDDLEIVMVLLETAAKDVYLVKDKNAIVYSDGNKWLYSENFESSITNEQVVIKF